MFVVGCDTRGSVVRAELVPPVVRPRVGVSRPPPVAPAATLMLCCLGCVVRPAAREDTPAARPTASVSVSTRRRTRSAHSIRPGNATNSNKQHYFSTARPGKVKLVRCFG
jgi:hypothetical protein